MVRRDDRPPRIARFAACAGLAILFAWTLGRAAGDRWMWSQVLWWIPSVIAIVLATASWLSALACKGRKALSVRLLGLGILAACLWTALVEWRCVNALRLAPQAGDDAARVLFWNLSAKDVPTTLLAARDADLIILANPPFGHGREGIGQALHSSYTLASRGTTLLACRGQLSDLRFVGLGLRGARLGFQPGEANAIDDGWALCATVWPDRLASPLVVWVIDLPHDPWVHRRAMLTRAAGVLKAPPDGRGPFPAPDLIVGDFNTPRSSPSLRILTDPLRDVYSAAGWGPRSTWPRVFALWTIDLAFARKGLEVLGARVINPGHGQHRVLEFELRPAK